MKDINIVLVNYKCKDDILCAVKSLFLDIKNSFYNIQLTVVDNTQNIDGIKNELASNFPSVKYISTEKNLGFGKANTLGFKTTPARYYFALNRDTKISPDSNTVDKIIDYMDKNYKIGCIGPKLINSDGSLQYSCYRFDLPSIMIKPLRQLGLDKKYKWIKKHTDKLIMKDFDHNSTRPVDWVLGAAMVVRKEVVDDVGFFDDRYFMYMEDCDWCRQMWEKNWPIYYVHDIVIEHKYARESAKVPGVFKALLKNKLARYHLVSWLRFLLKWRGTNKYYRYKYK